MKQKFVATVATVVLLLGMGACTDKSDTTISKQEMEKNLVGLWYEEFDYEDVTEDGKPFNHALIAVEAKADHTGYIALAVFDDEFNEPLEIYGGPKDAPFTWKVTEEDRVPMFLHYMPYICYKCLSFWSLMALFVASGLLCHLWITMTVGMILTALDTIAYIIHEKNNTISVKDFDFS